MLVLAVVAFICLLRAWGVSAIALERRAESIKPPPFNGDYLFPVPVLQGWTTAPVNVTISAAEVKRLPLKDSSLNISHTAWAAAELRKAPDGTPAYKAFYPKNSWSTSPTAMGGFGQEFKGYIDLSTSDHILFSYAVYFPEDFDFVWGGKLPGPFGGADDHSARGCAGGRQTDRDKCWSSRLMWRKDGAGEIYVYVVQDNYKGMLRLQGSEQDPGIYGFSLARGAFTFKRGGWTVVSQRVQLNTYGKKDGELELWVDGQSIIHATGLVLRAAPTTQVRGFMAETFFGGSNSSWASPKDQASWFAGYSAAILAPNVSPAQGHAMYPLRANSSPRLFLTSPSFAMLSFVAISLVALVSL